MRPLMIRFGALDAKVAALSLLYSSLSPLSFSLSFSGAYDAAWLAPTCLLDIVSALNCDDLWRNEYAVKIAVHANV